MSSGKEDAYVALRAKPIGNVVGTIRDTLDRMEKHIPHLVDVRSSVRSLGCEFSWASEFDLTSQKKNSRTVSQKRANGRPIDGALMLLRLSGGITDLFGIMAEVPVFVSRHEDIQSRTWVQVKRKLAAIDDRDFDRQRVLCFTKSGRYSSSLRPSVDLQVDLVPIVGAEPEAIVKSFVSYFVDNFLLHDHYKPGAPVVSEDFFGRRPVLNALRYGVENQEIQGVYGLRKSGKTSVLKELQRRNSISRQNVSWLNNESKELESKRRLEGTVYVYHDLEGSGYDASSSISAMMKGICSDIVEEMRSLSATTKELADLSRVEEEVTPTQFQTVMLKFLRYRRHSNLHVVLMLDEIEHITVNLEAGSERAQLIVQFFQILRKLIQTSKDSRVGAKFSLLLAGLAPPVDWVSELGGFSNPLLQVVPAHFMGPLQPEDSADLLEGLGKRMGLVWSDSALAAAFESTGGNVFLLREVGSAIFALRSRSDFSNFLVERAHVEEVEKRLPFLAKAYVQESLKYLEKWYEREKFVLEVAASDGLDIQSVADEIDVDLDRLFNLGLLEHGKDGSVSYSKLAAMAFRP